MPPVEEAPSAYVPVGSVVTPHYSDDLVTLHHGDCLDVLRTLPDASVDAVVTDPPYGLEFMGREWDGADGFRRSLNPNDVGRDSAFGRTSRTSPEYRAGTLFQEWCEAWARECLRVLKPGGHLLTFGGTRTFHRLACAVEDAGFEVRDSIAWLYGSGFPKSLDVSKAIDKLDASAERLARAREFQAYLRQHLTPQQVNDLTGTDMGHHLTTHPTQPSVATADLFDRLRPWLPTVPPRIEELVAQRTVESENYKRRQVVGTSRMVDTSRSRMGFAGETYGGDGSTRDVDVTAPHTPEAARWQGWGTALKPAYEPIVVGRKPLAGTVAGNVLLHGTGALNIDACRVDWGAEGDKSADRKAHGYSDGARKAMGGVVASESSTGFTGEVVGADASKGRWPANVVLDKSQAAELDRQSGTLTSGVLAAHHARAPKEAGILGAYGSADGARGYGDSGGASRFFPTFRYEAKAPTDERPRDGDVAHPTVKPLDLMRWLVRLVTPPGGVVLEPFAGSGTTAEACVIEGFRCIAVEREATYLPLIVARLSKPIQPDLFGGAA